MFFIVFEVQNICAKLHFFKQIALKKVISTKSTDIKTFKQEKYLHYTMSFVGGMFAIYALLEHSNVFGSAETSNMILLVNDLLTFDLFHIIIRVTSLIVYAAGITASLWMAAYCSSLQKMICIATDAVAAVILILTPTDTPPIMALYPVAFAMSIQWCTFRGVEKNPSATTFSTGNFRQLVTNIFNYCTKKDIIYLSNVKFYIFTMLSFHSGVALGYILKPYILHHSIGLVFIPLLVAAFWEYAIDFRQKEHIEEIPQNVGCDDV